MPAAPPQASVCDRRQSAPIRQPQYEASAESVYSRREGGTTDMSLATELDTFERHVEEFRRQHSREWVVISGREVFGFFRSFEQAAIAADRAFGGQKFLIRQIDAPAVVLPFVVLND
ncbi:MAG: hypothetical protein AAFX03_05975 [Pseudomonadota bacterium]